MSIFLDLLLITLIVCFIIDVSGFIDDGLKPMVAWLVNRKSKIKVKPENITIGKPISCSMCMTFWASLIYLLIVNQFTLVNLTIVCMLAMLAQNISGILFMLKDILATLECWVQKQLHKNLF